MFKQIRKWLASDSSSSLPREREWIEGIIDFQQGAIGTWPVAFPPLLYEVYDPSNPSVRVAVLDERFSKECQNQDEEGQQHVKAIMAASAKNLVPIIIQLSGKFAPFQNYREFFVDPGPVEGGFPSISIPQMFKMREYVRNLDRSGKAVFVREKVRTKLEQSKQR